MHGGADGSGAPSARIVVLSPSTQLTKRQLPVEPLIFGFVQTGHMRLPTQSRWGNAITPFSGRYVQKSRFMHKIVDLYKLTYTKCDFMLCILYVRNGERVWRFTDTRG
jgi:hypothetical protein